MFRLFISTFTFERRTCIVTRRVFLAQVFLLRLAVVPQSHFFRAFLYFGGKCFAVFCRNDVPSILVRADT